MLQRIDPRISDATYNFLTGTRELAVGEDGEIIIRGPQIMQGYWKAPEETARALGFHF